MGHDNKKQESESDYMSEGEEDELDQLVDVEDGESEPEEFEDYPGNPFFCHYS